MDRSDDIVTSVRVLTGVAPWTAQHLRDGQAIDLVLYGDRVTGTVAGISGDSFLLSLADDTARLRSSTGTAFGTALIPVDGGAAEVPVSARVHGQHVRVQVVGEATIVQRRVHRRITVAAPATLTWLDRRRGRQSRVTATTRDISLGGARLDPGRVVWPGLGAEVEFVAELPTGPFLCDAEVLGTTPDYGLRLRFTGLTAQSAALIEALHD